MLSLCTCSKNEDIQAQNERVLIADGSTRGLHRLIHPMYTSDGVYPEGFQQPMSYAELQSLPSKCPFPPSLTQQHRRVNRRHEKPRITSLSSSIASKLSAILSSYHIASNSPTTHFRCSSSSNNNMRGLPNPLGLPQRRPPAIANRAGLVQLFPQGYDPALSAGRVDGGWDDGVGFSMHEVKKARLDALLGFLGVRIEEW